MRFRRYVVHADHTERTVTSRRYSAAERSVKNDKENNALTPSLVKFATAEDRIQAMAERSNRIAQSWRDHRAKKWREVRKEIKQFSALTRQGIVKQWNHSKCPGDPSYLLTYMRQVNRGERSPWADLRRLRQLQLVGAGRLPRSVVFKQSNQKK